MQLKLSHVQAMVEENDILVNCMTLSLIWLWWERSATEIVTGNGRREWHFSELYGIIIKRNVQVSIRKHRFWIHNTIFEPVHDMWYLSHRRTAKAQARLCIPAVSPEPSLFAHITYGSRQRVWPNIRRVATVGSCACVFEEWVYGGR